MNNERLSLNTKEWDYTEHAKYYDQRPNYDPEAITFLAKYIGADIDSFIAADIGAGTGNLSVLLADKVSRIHAVEPNAAMREIGTSKTRSLNNVSWTVGTGEETGLPDSSVNLAAFGSSFNCTDRLLALKESHRIVKPGGWFSCMWNNRDLADPTQLKVESVIKEFYPDYSHGSRREQQADVILSSGLFNRVYYYEKSQYVDVPIEQYIAAWRSVKNAFWDFSTEDGKELFDKIAARIRTVLNESSLKIKYDTRVWIAERQ